MLYCLSFETSLFVASYDSQGHGGGIRPRLHTSLPGVKLKLCYNSYSRDTEHIENTYYCTDVLPRNCLAVSARIVLAACLQFCCLALGLGRTTLKTPLLLSELLCNLATSCSMAHREHSSYCCVFVGTCILSRCLAMIIFVTISLQTTYQV
jgi:hypothetical protein